MWWRRRFLMWWRRARPSVQRKLLRKANRRPPSLVDVSRAVTATSGRRAVTAGRCVPQCRAPQLLHPARALGSPWRARVNDSSAARHRGESRVRLVRRRCPGVSGGGGAHSRAGRCVRDSSPAIRSWTDISALHSPLARPPQMRRHVPLKSEVQPGYPLAPVPLGFEPEKSAP
jgi:hypothetical protein